MSDEYVPGHGPECEWDEVRARMWCGQEHSDRYWASKPNSLWTRIERWVFGP